MLRELRYGEQEFRYENPAPLRFSWQWPFVHLVRQLEQWDFAFVDCQVHTDHLERFGAQHIPREKFLRRLRDALAQPTRMPGQKSLEKV